MENVRNEIEFERKLQLKNCVENRNSIIKSLGYSDELNPFGDNNLSMPFIWEKRLEREKRSITFKNKCEAYPWYVYGVCPINTTEILEIKRRRESDDEIFSIKNHSNNHFDYNKWIENENKFEKKKLEYSSIIRVKEHRENIFDIFFWKLIIYSFYNSTSREKTLDIDSFISLMSTGINASIPYLKEFKQKKLFLSLEQLINNHLKNDNWHISEIIQLVTQHRQLIHITSEITLIPEWSDILEGLEILLKYAPQSHNFSMNLTENEIGEINKIINDKDVSELRTILFKAKKFVHEDFWKNVVFQIQLKICKNYVEMIENSYQNNFEDWISEISSDYRIPLPEQKINEVYEKNTTESTNQSFNLMNKNSQLEDYEQIDQLINLPAVEFSSFNRFHGNNSPKSSELNLPFIYSMIKARYYWNQYNKNYYSNDALPPKIIHGYKFKIKYPLLEKSENSHIVPRWYLTNKKYLEKNGLAILNEDALVKVQDETIYCEDETLARNKLLVITCDKQIYKDVVFSIIDKEWDLNSKNGFKSYFENATLYLNFNFKHPKYKR
ncbi:Cactin-like protein [Cryptosporidium felis]|nr:Cactin-like protein [Cryptosporidium felis]